MTATSIAFLGQLSTPPVLARVLRTQPTEAIQFTGKSEPEIQVLQGNPRWGIERIKRMLQGGTWIFLPDGTFVFSFPLTTDDRADLFPISGTYIKRGNVLEFQGERQSLNPSISIDGVKGFDSAAVDGFVRLEKEAVILDVTYTVSASNAQRIVKIVQTLSSETLPADKIPQIPGHLSLNETFSLNGSWNTNIFGKLELQQKEQQVRGTYTGRGGGTIEGIFQNNRLNFTWKDSLGEGWGFFRAVPGVRTLVGTWGQGKDKIGGNSLVASWIRKSSAITLPNLPLTDKIELRYLGASLVGINRCDLAIEVLESALNLYQQEIKNPSISNLLKISNLISELNIYTTLSACDFRHDNYDRLLGQLEGVVEVRRQLNQKEDLASINRESASLITLQLTDYIELWRLKLITDLDKIAALEKAQPFFKKFTKSLLELGVQEEALVVSEISRARAFADLLATGLSTENTQKIGANLPNLLQIQQIAKNQNATLVEYLIVPKQELYIWVVKPTGEIKFKQVDLKSSNTSLEDLVINSRQSMGIGGRSLYTEFEPTPAQSDRLTQLHKLLIEPIAQFLPTNPDERVIFIPHNELFLVPFPALQDTSGKYLIQKHTILTAPSIQVLQLTHEKRKAVSGNGVLVVGNPTMPSVTTKVGESSQQLTNLPGAEKEATEIAELLNTKALTGKQATKASVLPKLPNARIIHLATHGLLDDFKGLGVPGAIALAPDGTGELNDGLLTSNEIFDLKLNAELVVLSACDTGRGRLTGDGVIGLSRSLITAGVPSVIVSLWSVPDAPTASLMTRFYQNLQKDPDKAQALRQAMLTTMQNHPNPRDWAAFTLIGEAQ
ncbi:MAG: hypothetical protein Fur006_62590 [Coleofasciculaceae cyanobacterium]